MEKRLERSKPSSPLSLPHGNYLTNLAVLLSMLYKIVCPFSVASSHEIHTVGFRGGNEINLTVPIKFQAPLGFEGTTIEITQREDKKYVFEVFSETLATTEDQISFLEKFSEYLSLLIARGEANPHYGTSFVAPSWIDLVAHPVKEENASMEEDGLLQSRVFVRDRWEITSTRTLSIGKHDLAGAIHSDLLRFYVDGLRAEHGKSKYFHWFLVLEHLENSDRYREMFNARKLFTADEIEQITRLAEAIGGPKKGALMNVLSRTSEGRNSKLLQMLESLGIITIKAFEGEIQVTENMIKEITQGRNALFHSGSNFPEDTLWKKLFPLATLVVEHVSRHPTCLDGANGS